MRNINLVIFVLDTNKLYGSGWNKYRQICSEEVENIYNFVFSYDLKDLLVLKLVCGPWNSVVISK